MKKIRIFVILSGVILSGAPLIAQAYQIKPNPNPSGSTITVNTSDAENNVEFNNLGDLAIVRDGVLGGTLTNNAILNISLYGGLFNDYFLNNFGALNNTGSISNYGALNNYSSGVLDNDGRLFISMGGVLNNDGTLDNRDRLDIMGAGILNNDGNLNNSGTLNNGNAVRNNGTLSNSGTLTNFLGNLDNNRGGTLNNSGTLDNLVGTMINGGTLNNSGTLNNVTLFFNTNTGTLDNTGTLNNVGGYGGGLYNGGTLINSGIINSDGTYLQEAGQTINNGSFTQSAFQFDGGSLSGTGSLTGDVTIGSAASVNPGDGLGTLTINGDYFSSGGLIFEIGGLGSGLYDVLSIDGSASFTGGNAEFRFINGFGASAGDYWDFLLVSSLFGWDTLSFSFIDLGPGLDWDFVPLSTGGERLLIASSPSVSVPEPSTMLLLGSGMAGLIALRRKFST